MTTNKTQNEAFEAVVGVFENSDSAKRAAIELRRQNFVIQRDSCRDLLSDNEMPEIIYDQVDDVVGADALCGVLKGGAIGGGSRLLITGVPGLNVAAPLVGAIAGAWIGDAAAVDEAIRGIELPDKRSYQNLHSDGKSFVVISASVSEQLEYAKPPN
jgi:hypothetical protein